MVTTGRDAAARVSSSPVPAVFFLGAVLLALVVFFWRLGDATFWDPDEAHYAETTRELIDTGDWLAPRYNGAVFFDKPILFHWLQALPMIAIGPNELAARLMPAIAALVLVAVTAWLGRKLMSDASALVAALLLATNPAMFALARYAILDTVFTMFLFGGAALVSVAALRDRPRLQWPGYAAIALAVLTKGPLALVLCGLGFGLALAGSSEARARLLRLRIFSGLAMIVLVAAPWFVYMALRFRSAFVDGYLLDENIRLYAADRFTPTASSSVWFYFRVLAAGLLPWTGLVVGQFVDDVRAAWRRDGSLNQVDVLLWSWTIGIVLFFTFSRFKLDHYVFPTAPALCLIAARAWLTARDRPGDARHLGARIGLLLVGPLLVILAGTVAFLLLTRFNLPGGALVVPAIIGAAGIAMIIDVALRKPRLVPWPVFAALAVTYAGVIVWVLPALETRKVVPDVARWVAMHASGGERIATYRLNRWNTAFRFYVAHDVAMIDAPDEASALFQGTEPFYCTMLSGAYDEFVARGAPLRIAYERAGMWATSGRILWRREAPLTRFVVVTRR